MISSDKKNIFILLLSPLSLIYIFYCNNYGYRFTGITENLWNFKKIFTMFYSARLVLIGINSVKNFEFRVNKILDSLGQKSFYIFFI